MFYDSLLHYCRIGFKNRLFSVLNRVEPTLLEYNQGETVNQLKEFLSGDISQQELMQVKQAILELLNNTLDLAKVRFIEIEEPTNEYMELFRGYLQELKDYKQELTTPYSELRKKVSSVIKMSKSSVLSELRSQEIMFPTQYLDSVVKCEEAKQDKTGDWVVNQINEGIKALSEELNLHVEACTDVVNEVLNSKIQTFSVGLNYGVIASGAEASTSDKALGMTRQALPAVGLASITATLASALINPFVGILGGLALGGAFFSKSIRSTDIIQRQNELKQKLSPQITLALHEIRTNITSRYDELEEQVSNYSSEMVSIVNEEMQKCIDAIKSCENDNKDFYKQLELINGHMTCLETYIKQVEMMMSNPFKESRGNSTPNTLADKREELLRRKNNLFTQEE